MEQYRTQQPVPALPEPPSATNPRIRVNRADTRAKILSFLKNVIPFESYSASFSPLSPWGPEDEESICSISVL